MFDQINSILNDLTKVQRVLVFFIIAILVYGLSAGVSYTLISPTVTGGPTTVSNVNYEVPNAEGIISEDPNAPRIESCPLDGVMHTKKAKDAWGKRLPLSVMIENHSEARPQSGLSQADVVYEAVAEGGITRFMAIYLCNLGDFQVGPVRSARTYFLDWESEYDGPYVHVGGANTPGPADALGQILTYKIKDLNQFGIGFPTFWRDYQRLGHPVATEHTMYSTTKKLWDVAEKKGFSASSSANLNWQSKFVPWLFKDDSPGGSVKKAVVNFWEGKGDYSVEWNYDEKCNCYKRKNGGASHTDLNNNQQLSAKNVIVEFMQEGRANDGYEGNAHLLYTNKGTGKALIFMDGKVIEGTWSKPTRVARTKFLDSSGKEVELNKGPIWIEIVPLGSEVKY